MQPSAFRIAVRLACQLVPAVAVSAVVLALLVDRAEPPATATVVPQIVPARADMIIEVVRDERLAAVRQPAAEPAIPDAPKRVAAKQPRLNPPPKPPKPATDDRAMRETAAIAAEAASLAPPQSLAPPALADDEHFVVARLRDTAATIRRMPARIGSTVAGWFEEGAPPRPPADVPERNFVNAAM
jgi:hypothetical protein